MLELRDITMRSQVCDISFQHFALKNKTKSEANMGPKYSGVTGRFTPKTFPPWSFPLRSFYLYLSPVVFLPPCPSRFAPMP